MTSAKPRTWRLVPMSRARGTYFVLQTGRAKERVSLTLGYVTQEEAERALRVLQAEEEATFGAPRHGYIERWYRQDQEAAVKALTSAGGFDEDPFGDAASDPGGLTLREYVDEIWTPYREKARPRSWRTERGFWKQINEAIGNRRLRDLCTPRGTVVIDEYLQGMTLADGRPASASTKRLHRAAIKALLKHARRKDHVRTMPDFDIMTIETDPDNPGWGSPDALTMDEVRRLIEAEDPDSARGPARAWEIAKRRALWAVCCFLGVRPGETDLRWEDVDWNAKGPGWHGAVTVRGTKTRRSEGRVPLLPQARSELTSWWVRCGRPDEGFIFPARRTTPNEPYRASYKKALRSACQRAGIDLEAKRITPYSLRHTCATLLAEAGLRDTSIAKILRHSDPRMVQQRYDHSDACAVPDLELAAKL